MKIQEIAQLAGVSPSTVSRTFANHPHVRQEVRDHILAIAREHRFHPKLAMKQKNVVVITPYDPVYPVHSCVDMLLMALLRELPKNDFRVEILPYDNLARLNAMPFCAALAIGAECADFSDWQQKFAAPLVIVDRRATKIPQDVYCVYSDEEQGMALAIGELYAKGCRRIGCIIHGDEHSGNGKVRFDAIVRELAARDLPCGEDMVCFSGHGSERYVELVGRMLARGVDALFCPGGNAGIVVQYALALFGKKIPGDVSLIASEQTHFSQYAVPPQTTITQRYADVAAAAVNIICQRLIGEKMPINTVLPYRIISRESTAAYRPDQDSASSQTK